MPSFPLFSNAIIDKTPATVKNGVEAPADPPRGICRPMDEGKSPLPCRHISRRSADSSDPPCHGSKKRSVESVEGISLTCKHDSKGTLQGNKSDILPKPSGTGNPIYPWLKHCDSVEFPDPLRCWPRFPRCPGDFSWPCIKTFRPVDNQMEEIQWGTVSNSSEAKTNTDKRAEEALPDLTHNEEAASDQDQDSAAAADDNLTSPCHPPLRCHTMRIAPVKRTEAWPYPQLCGEFPTSGCIMTFRSPNEALIFDSISGKDGAVDYPLPSEFIRQSEDAHHQTRDVATVTNTGEASALAESAAFCRYFLIFAPICVLFKHVVLPVFGKRPEGKDTWQVYEGNGKGWGKRSLSDSRQGVEDLLIKTFAPTHLDHGPILQTIPSELIHQSDDAHHQTRDVATVTNTGDALVPSLPTRACGYFFIFAPLCEIAKRIARRLRHSERSLSNHRQGVEDPLIKTFAPTNRHHSPILPVIYCWQPGPGCNGAPFHLDLELCPWTELHVGNQTIYCRIQGLLTQCLSAEEYAGRRSPDSVLVPGAKNNKTVIPVKRDESVSSFRQTEDESPHKSAEPSTVTDNEDEADGIVPLARHDGETLFRDLTFCRRYPRLCLQRTAILIWRPVREGNETVYCLSTTWRNLCISEQEFIKRFPPRHPLEYQSKAYETVIPKWVWHPEQKGDETVYCRLTVSQEFCITEEDFLSRYSLYHPFGHPNQTAVPDWAWYPEPKGDETIYCRPTGTQKVCITEEEYFSKYPFRRPFDHEQEANETVAPANKREADPSSWGGSCGDLVPCTDLPTPAPASWDLLEVREGNKTLYCRPNRHTGIKRCMLIESSIDNNGANKTTIHVEDITNDTLPPTKNAKEVLPFPSPKYLIKPEPLAGIPYRPNTILSRWPRITQCDPFPCPRSPATRWDWIKVRRSMPQPSLYCRWSWSKGQQYCLSWKEYARAYGIDSSRLDIGNKTTISINGTVKETQSNSETSGWKPDEIKTFDRMPTEQCFYRRYRKSCVTLDNLDKSDTVRVASRPVPYREMDTLVRPDTE